MIGTGAAPDRRRGEIDVLRGYALFGVFYAHVVGKAFFDLPVPWDRSGIWCGEVA